MRKLFLAIFLCIHLLAAAQYNMWRGPQRSGHFPDTGLLKTWPEGGPELVFKTDGIGEGFSSPVGHRGTIYVTGKKDTMDLVTAIDETGRIKWQVPYGRSWIRSFPNTRSTPTLEDGRMYLLSGTGRLVCLDTENTREIWSVDVDADFEADWHRWGVAESPLIVDDMVVCSPSGKQTTMVAFNKFTGELVWKSEPSSSQRSYVSPVIYEFNDIRLILGMTARDAFAVDPESGEILWTYNYLQVSEKYRNRENMIMTNTPVYMEDEIFITTGYDFPSVMLKMAEDGNSVSEKWRNHTLDNHVGHVILYDGHIYGSNWKDNRFGKWVCVDWKTGEVMWVENWHNKGSIIAADGMLYIYEEKSGNVGLLKPDPETFELSGSFQITEGKGPYWAHPAIYEGKLMIRHGDYLFVYNIRR
jgi:outer membrane protein assembly factor BamB